MTNDILEMMEERRKLKGQDETRYEVLNKQVKKKCTEAKEAWLNEQCKEIEELSKRDSQKMYDRVKLLTGKKRLRTGNAIKKKDGKIAMEEEEVLGRWKEYVEELFEDDRGEVPQLNNINMGGPPILKDEIEKAMRGMKEGKAVGEDGVNIEMLKAVKDFSIEKITKIANIIYEEGTITEEMCKSVFITIPKQAGTLECNKHRTISIISQITKLILRVILERVRGKIRQEVAEEQYGFVEGKGTRNAIFIVRMLSEKAIEMQKDLYLCFIDYEKPFDRVSHKDIVEMLMKIGIDGKDLRVIINLYENPKAAVRVAGGRRDK